MRALSRIAVAACTTAGLALSVPAPAQADDLSRTVALYGRVVIDDNCKIKDWGSETIVLENGQRWERNYATPECNEHRGRWNVELINTNGGVTFKFILAVDKKCKICAQWRNKASRTWGPDFSIIWAPSGSPDTVWANGHEAWGNVGVSFNG